MKISVNQIPPEGQERLEIYCRELSSEVNEIVSFVKSRQGQLTGTIDNEQYEIPITDVFYIEAVDNRVFIYCKEQVYEVRQKLYELEEMLVSKHFLRISKSMLINLMKIASIKPAMNGRFTAVLQTGEEIIISRKYVPEFKNAIKGGRR